MAKQTQAKVSKKEQEQLEKRFKGYLDKLQALNAEEGFQPLAIIKFDERQGSYPFLSFEQYVTPKPPVEKEPKADGQSDSDDKGTEG